MKPTFITTSGAADCLADPTGDRRFMVIEAQDVGAYVKQTRRRYWSAPPKDATRPVYAVILTAPEASGKTRHAQQLCQHFDCGLVVDGWSPGERILKNALHLTNADPTAVRRAAPGKVQIVKADAAYIKSLITGAEGGSA